eukprot:COSAG05_NODE_2373_length_3161_cov_16.174233_3_plen_276_part_00
MVLHLCLLSVFSAGPHGTAEIVSAIYASPNPDGARLLSRTDVSAIPLWPSGKVPGEKAGTVGAEYDTCLTHGMPVGNCQDLSVHNVTEPTITPFLVDGADSAVVIAPGGGYGILAINREGTDIAAWLNSVGVSAFVLKYRVPGRSWLPFGAAPLMDAQRAMGMVREMASSGKVKGLNESKIGFMGFSAGGHLTGHLNVAWASRTYPQVDGADNKPCRPDFSMMVYVRPALFLSHAHTLLRPTRSSNHLVMFGFCFALHSPTMMWRAACVRSHGSL